MSTTPRKPKKLLSGEQKYDLWLRMLTSQITTTQAATEAGVDRSTIMTVRKVARDAAVAALSARPGQRKVDRDEQTEIVHLQHILTKLDISDGEDGDGRVLAVLSYLRQPT